MIHILQIPEVHYGALAFLALIGLIGLYVYDLRIFLIVVAAALLGLLAVGAHANTPQLKTRWPGYYHVVNPRVIDGDTVEVTFQDGPCGYGPCAGAIRSIRLAGVDTPEHRLCRHDGEQSCAQCPEELALAGKAEDYTAKAIGEALRLRVTGLERGSYAGRVVGDLQVQGDSGTWYSLSAGLLKAGLAEAYDPDASGSFKKEKGWCAK